MMVARSSGPAAVRRDSRSAFVTPAPSAMRASIAPRSMTSIAVSGDSESEATFRANAAWASVSTNRVVMFESDVIQSIWEADDVSYTGTGIAPADQIAKSRTVHSMRVRHG